MSNAALGYHKVMKENRSLHNMVQDLKGINKDYIDKHNNVKGFGIGGNRKSVPK